MTATSPLTYAGPGRRMVAFGLDFLLIGAYILLLLAVGVSANAVAGRLPTGLLPPPSFVYSWTA